MRSRVYPDASGGLLSIATCTVDVSAKVYAHALRDVVVTVVDLQANTTLQPMAAPDASRNPFVARDSG